MENKEVILLLKDELLKAEEKVIKLKSELEKAEKNLITYNRMTNQDDWFDMKEAAKILNYKGYGRNKIYELLRIAEVLNKNNEPYQQQVNNERFKIIIVQKKDIYDVVREFKVTFVSIKGLDFIRKLLSDITGE